MIKPEVLDAMVAAGCTAEQIVAAVKADALSEDARAAHKREVDAARKRRQRENERGCHDMSRGQSVTGSDNADDLSSPEVFPQTPFPKPHQSNPPSPPKGGSSPAEIDRAFDVWDEMAAASGLATVRIRSEARRRKLASVLRTHGLEVWREACQRIGKSSFCRGETGREGWRADLDFVLQAKSFARLLEGQYDDRPQARGSPRRQNSAEPRNISEASRVALAHFLEQENGTEHDPHGSGLGQNVRYLAASGR